MRSSCGVTIRMQNAQWPASKRAPMRMATTDSPLPPGPLTVTVVAKDWAPAQKSLQITPEISSASFRLQPGKLIRIRFVDEAGAAIPGVSVTTERWRGGNTLYNRECRTFSIRKSRWRADRHGIYEWNWAPEDPVTFAFFKEGFQPIRDPR